MMTVGTFINIRDEDGARYTINLGHLQLVEWEDRDDGMVRAVLCVADGTDLVVTDREQLNELADALTRCGVRR